MGAGRRKRPTATRFEAPIHILKQENPQCQRPRSYPGLPCGYTRGDPRDLQRLPSAIPVSHPSSLLFSLRRFNLDVAHLVANTERVRKVVKAQQSQRAGGRLFAQQRPPPMSVLNTSEKNRGQPYDTSIIQPPLFAQYRFSVFESPHHTHVPTSTDVSARVKVAGAGRSD